MAIIGCSKVVAQYRQGKANFIYRAQVLHNCSWSKVYTTLSYKARRPLEQQRMADLPRDRTDPSPPFTYCDMDCFGPFYTRKVVRNVNGMGSFSLVSAPEPST